MSTKQIIIQAILIVVFIGEMIYLTLIPKEKRSRFLSSVFFISMFPHFIAIFVPDFLVFYLTALFITAVILIIDPIHNFTMRKGKDKESQS